MPRIPRTLNSENAKKCQNNHVFQNVIILTVFCITKLEHALHTNMDYRPGFLRKNGR